MTNQQDNIDADVTHAALTAAIDKASIELDGMEREGFDSDDAEYQVAERQFFALYDKRAALDDDLLASPVGEFSYKCATAARVIELNPERASELLRLLADQVEAKAA